MLIFSLRLIYLLLEIFQSIDNVYAHHGKKRKYTIDKKKRIIGGRRAEKGIEIQITNQIEIHLNRLLFEKIQ